MVGISDYERKGEAMKTEKFRIFGEVKGFIWMPSMECTKEFDKRFVRCNPDKRFVSSDEVSNLREALLKITNDGDFQSCSIDWAVLEIEKRKGHKTESSHFSLYGNDGTQDLYCRA